MQFFLFSHIALSTGRNQLFSVEMFLWIWD